MYKTLFHAIFSYDSGETPYKPPYRRDVFRQMALPVAPVIGFAFCPNAQRAMKCDDWKAEEVVFDLHTETFIVVIRCMDCECKEEVDRMTQEFLACGWQSSNPLDY